jgi:4-amino-4-deoxy-L-arabinose transferase-like glycosyltransferase
MALFLQLYLGSAQMGLAYDELFHLPAGVAMLDTGVRRSTLDHPPLGHLLAGLGSWLIEPAYDRDLYFKSDFAKNGFTFGYSFFDANARQLGQVLLTARLPFMLSCVLGGLYSYLLARSFWGKTAGLFSLLFYAFCPTLIAWNRFVYLDGLLASTSIAALAHLCWFLRSRRPVQLVALVLTTVAVLCSKYSGMFILPLVAVALLVPPVWFAEQDVPLKRRLLDLSAWLVGTLGLLWVAFGCKWDPLFYLRGTFGIYTSAPPGYRFYLLGEFKPSWWYYYLVQWCVKSTIPTLLVTAACLALMMIGLVLRGQVALRRNAWPLLILLGMAFGFLALTSWKSLAIGARYLVPMYPPICVAAAALFRQRIWRSGWFKPALWALAMWHVTACLRVFPDEMGYFNELVGGSERGIFIANDASLDAGQNLPRLARYLRARGNPKVKLYYQGTDDPSRYGIVYEPVSRAEWDSASTPGLYAISSYPLAYGQLVARENSNHRDWLRVLTPQRIIGNSIWIYEIR